MQNPGSGLKRRDFLKASVAAGAGAAALGGGAFEASAESKQKSEKTIGIPVKAFGKTGWNLPVLGMGGSAMVQIWTGAYGVELLPLEERMAMVRYAYEQGIRYFDTARVYGESESIMGEGLKGVRDKVYIATKVADPRPTHTRASIEKSLEDLQTDYVNCAQIHSPAIERVGFDGAMKIHEQLLKLKDEGLVRFIGLTTHVAFETVYKMIATGGFDQVLLAYGYFNKGMTTLLSNRNLQHRAMCLAKAHELDMGIVAMKVMGANVFSHNAGQVVPEYEPAKLQRLPAAAIRWVMQDSRVSMLNIGVSMPSDIDYNLEVLSGDLTLTNDDRRLLADFSGEAYESETFKEMEVV